MGVIGTPTVAVVAGNLVFVNVSINSSGGNAMLVDSGSPVVLIDSDPGLFSGLTLPNTANVIVDLNLLDGSGSPVVTVDSIPALQTSSAMMDATGIPGILGGDVMRQFSVQLDYSAQIMDGFCLGCTSKARDDVESPGSAVPFTLKGGGTGPVVLSATAMPVVTMPSTRIPVTVTVEGVTYQFIVDTGASEVSVRSSVYEMLIGDGRARLPGGLPVLSIDGLSVASVTRAKTLVVGAEMVTDAPVMTIPGDSLLDSISQELDPSGATQVDGLLGGSFLRNFLVTIDYPKGQLHLQRYTNETWKDEFQRVGVTISADPTTGAGYVVRSVYPGSDAESKGILANDEVLVIGETQLATLVPVTLETAVEADSLLEGAPGTTIAVTFGAAGSSSIANQKIDLLVDDLVPNPS